MDLVDHYIDTVKPLLPRDQRNDIAAELEGAINDRIVDREAELGRRLKDAEIDQLLQGFGHPFVVAAGYQPPRYLVGPSVFPLWWLAVRLGTALIVVASLARAAFLVLTAGPIVELLALWPNFFAALLFMVGLCTVVAATAERVQINWRAKDLPSLKMNLKLAPRPTAAWERKLSLGFGLVGLMFWIALPLWFAIAPEGARPSTWAARTGVTLAEGWWRLLYFGVIALAALDVALQFARLKAGRNTILGARLAQAGGQLVFILAAAMLGDPLLAGPHLADPRLARVVGGVNHALLAACSAGVVAVLIYVAWAVWERSRARDA